MAEKAFRFDEKTNTLSYDLKGWRLWLVAFPMIILLSPVAILCGLLFGLAIWICAMRACGEYVWERFTSIFRTKRK